MKQREGEATTQGGGEAKGGGRRPRNLPNPLGTARRPAPCRPPCRAPGCASKPSNLDSTFRSPLQTPGRGYSIPRPGPPRNLDNCMPRPPGAAELGKRRGEGSPGARSGARVPGRGGGERELGEDGGGGSPAACSLESPEADYTRSRDALGIEPPGRAASKITRLPGRGQVSLLSLGARIQDG